MKKIFLLTILLLQLTFVFGQKFDEQEVTTSWYPASKCFPEIYYQVITRYPNHPRNFKHDGTYSIWIKFKNVSGKPIKFWARMNIPNSSRGEFELDYQLAPGTTDQNPFGETHSTTTTNGVQINIFKATYNVNTTNYIECNNGILSNNANQTKNSNQQNDLTEYNRSKAEMDEKLKVENERIQRQNEENARKGQIWNNAIKQGVDAHNSGNYTEAKNQFIIAINNSPNEQDRQNAQNYYNRSVDAEKSQAKIKAIGELTTASANLITYFANRKNALRNTLSTEDGQALMDIVNSENPTEYVQNIIQIFTDLGYTFRETEHKENYVIITLNNDVANINDFMLIFIRPASYDEYNSISFSYHRRKKLLEQLSVLGDNLKGFDHPEIKGIPPSKQEKVLQKKIAEAQEKQDLAKLKPSKSNTIVGNNITVKSIIDRHIAAIGGIEKLKRIDNIFETIETKTGNIKNLTAKGKSWMIEVSNGKSIKYAFNGSTGYFQYEGSQKNNFDIEAIAEFKKLKPFQKIFELQANSDLKLGENERISGKDCYTLILTSKSPDYNSTTKYFFEISSGLWLGDESISLNTKTNEKHIRSISYENYREVGGILFPFTSTTISDDKILYKSTTTEIKLNEPVTDKDFE